MYSEKPVADRQPPSSKKKGKSDESDSDNDDTDPGVRRSLLTVVPNAKGRRGPNMWATTG